MLQNIARLANDRADLIEQRLIVCRLGLPAPTHLADWLARGATNAGIGDQQVERAGDDNWLDRRGKGGGECGIIQTLPHPPSSITRSLEPNRLLICDHRVVD